MKQSVIHHGLDQVILEQPLEASRHPRAVWDIAVLRHRMKQEGLVFKAERINRAHIKLRFPEFDLHIKQNGGWRRGRLHLHSRSVALSPDATWARAQRCLHALASIGDVPFDPTIASVDLCFDIQGLRPSAHLVGRFHSRSNIPCNPYVKLGFTSVSWGRARKLFTLYDKLAEIRNKPKKSYILDLWRSGGWDGQAPVARFEIRADKNVLRRFSPPLDLDAVAADGLDRLRLMRRVHLRSKGKSITREDGLWTRMRALHFEPLSRSAQKVTPKPHLPPVGQIKHAAGCAMAATAKLAALCCRFQNDLDAWARCLLDTVMEAEELTAPEFLDKVAFCAMQIGITGHEIRSMPWPPPVIEHLLGYVDDPEADDRTIEPDATGRPARARAQGALAR